MTAMFTMTDFVLKDWGVWAPGASGKQAWRERRPLAGTAPAEVPDFIPKLQQRRLSAPARAVFNAVHQCLESGAMPATVFSSAHGEVGKALEMLQTIQAGEALSPTAFSLSVHNAIAGLYSILYRNRREITVIAPGLEGMAPAFIEALGLLQEGASEVLVVFYDEPIAGFYPVAPFRLNADFTCALALRLHAAGEGMRMRLCCAPASRIENEQPRQLPDFVDFLVGIGNGFSSGFEGRGWRWEKI